MKTSDFDYELPQERIAQTPAEPRDSSRLLVYDRATGKKEHRIFHDLPQYLRKGDLLVINQTKVIPARIFGKKDETGGQVEVLLLRRVEENLWETLVGGKRLFTGKKIDIGISNRGGIRIDMPAGEILCDDIQSMFPFKNNLCYVALHGRDVRAILDQMAATSFQILGGVKVVAKNGKILSATVNGEPLDDDKVYAQ